MESGARKARAGSGKDEIKRTQIKKNSHDPLDSLRKDCVGRTGKRSSEKERRVDARALIADEGRDKLRKALGSCT